MVQDKRLADLAQRLDIDPAVLKEDFAVYVALQGDEPSAVTNVEPWPEPVDTKTVLTEVLAQFRRYVVVHDADALAIALWIMFAWVHEIAVHSTYLVFTGPEGDEGKSTACGVVKLLAPRSYAVTEPNAANVYRIADHRCPTLIIDDE